MFVNLKRVFMSIRFFKKIFFSEIGSSDYRILRNYLLHNKGMKGFRAILKDKIVFVFKVLALPVFLRVENINNEKSYIFDLEDNYKHRLDYLRYNNIAVSAGLIRMNYSGRIGLFNIQVFFAFIRLYFMSIYKAVLFSLVSGRIPVSGLARYFTSKLKVDLYKPDELFIFYSYRVDNYLLSLYVSAFRDAEVTYFINQMLYESLRYAFFHNINLCFSSSLFKEEYDSLKKIGWIFDTETKYIIASNENMAEQSNNKYLYDLAFYSSGFWARKDGVHNDLNEYALRNKLYEDNYYSRVDVAIMRFLQSYANKNGLKYRIYLHPYEKQVAKKFGVLPPYWDLLLPVDQSLEGVTDFYEAKIGIVQHSTIFYDRLEQGLLTFCYQDLDNKKIIQINLGLIPSCSKYGFSNLDELEAKLNTLFGINL